MGGGGQWRKRGRIRKRIVRGQEIEWGRMEARGASRERGGGREDLKGGKEKVGKKRERMERERERERGGGMGIFYQIRKSS